jgi:hypothetical protein
MAREHAREGDCGCRKPRFWPCKVWDIITREPKTPFGDPCVRFPGHIIRKPDPCIYSQFLLLQLRQPVTWDNPDVRILLGGIEQDSYNLTAGTEYVLEITVHNSSRDEPASGTTVDVGWIEFGAGGQIRHPIAAVGTDVPIWPGVSTVLTNWRTPDTPGHYCIEVLLAHPDDGNPANNRGWNNTQVYAASSPVTRPIRVFNRYPTGCPEVKEGGGPRLRPHRVLLGWGILGAVAGGYLQRQFVADGVANFGLKIGLGYLLLSAIGLLAESAYAWVVRSRRKAPPDRHERVPCNLVAIDVDSYTFSDGSGKAFDPEAAFTGKAPMWGAHVVPNTFAFAPAEAYRDVELRLDAPDEPGPPGAFNVNVWQGGVPAGGVTILVTRGGS